MDRIPGCAARPVPHSADGGGNHVINESDLRVLNGFTGVDPQFISQQDSQPFVCSERLRNIAPRRERMHQKQMS